MGKLTLLSTPIGNLGDLTPRAREAIQNGRHFAVEDTRSFRDLLRALGLSWEGKNIDSFHDHSGEQKLDKFLGLLEAGEEVLLASEAGSPIISDPAFPLVRKALEGGHEVDTLPGPSSVLAALELAGIAPQPFHFVGFLPRGAKEKENVLMECAAWRGTCVFFEAPQRAIETLELLVRVWPSGQFAVAREITKKFQSVYRFKACDWENSRAQIMEKGEFVIVAHPGDQGRGSGAHTEETGRLAQEYLDRPGDKNLAKLLAAILDRPSKEIYSVLTRSRE